ncbi:hypothetical protein MUU72_20580 [Streptomyces sp. RS10V-4]|uniref:hypothetical protein n=1 Tax=Streptomyces rhizoryzae TaxID=2932493 RepID=UPI0020035AD9|nr:hypothetical protein [Streptomyces rhizoryzae]MCK7625464.1 hypothetical protein [Streptomyces rhizoryzae]
MASASQDTAAIPRRPPRTPAVRPRPAAETCPRCGGQLAVNQDGWKICHACGYASPPGAAPPPRARRGGIVAPTVATPRRAR